MLPSNARALFASVAYALSVVAAITVAGFAALAALGAGFDQRAHETDQPTAVLTLADVPNLRAPQTPDRHAADVLPTPTPRVAAAATRAGTAKRGGMQRNRRIRRTSPRPGRARAKRPQTPAPRSQATAAASTLGVANDSAGLAAPTATKTSTAPSKRTRSRSTASTRHRAAAAAPGRERKQSASAKNVSSAGAPHPGRDAARAERANRSKRKAVGHGASKRSAAPQSTPAAAVPAPAGGPPAEVPGHARGRNPREHPHGENQGNGPHR